MKYEYLIFDLCILIFPNVGMSFIRSAHWPKFKSGLISILIIGLVFLVWDHAVTDIWWFFNTHYILGFYIGKLPIEEVLFFVCIPWSCLLIWENIKTLVKGKWSFPVEQLIMCVFLSVAIFGYFQGWWYSLSVAVGLVVLSILSLTTTHWLRTKAASVFVFVVTFLTLVFNSYLTGRPIVIYNEQFMSNFRIGTVPIEDVFYGLVLMGGIVFVYELLRLRDFTRLSN